MPQEDRHQEQQVRHGTCAVLLLTYMVKLKQYLKMEISPRTTAQQGLLWQTDLFDNVEEA